MTAPSDQLRAVVVQRAGNRCEYCQLPAQLQVGGFQMDHVVPRSRGGRTEADNLAWACPHCNAHKWAHVVGVDPESQQTIPLFNPRTQQWEDHFQWSEERPCEVVGTSAHGRATVARLQMNNPDLVSIRRLLTKLDIPWKAVSS
jgi:hypothetical protein